MTPTIDWYFDFVSPYSYICLHRLREIGRDVSYKPILFAGLLNHFGQKGPAEIPAKRRWTYRWCTWWAAELRIPFRFPAGHPFNPLYHLRLALACGSRPDAVARIFESIWTTGESANDPDQFSALCADLGVSADRLSEMKDPLRKGTEAAASLGVFGVPTFVIAGEVFWGADSVDFVKAFLRNPQLFKEAGMARVDALPVAAERPR
jgi:2-hydroxychromene-2-carboxylate isomerase